MHPTCQVDTIHPPRLRWTDGPGGCARSPAWKLHHVATILCIYIYMAWFCDCISALKALNGPRCLCWRNPEKNLHCIVSGSFFTCFWDEKHWETLAATFKGRCLLVIRMSLCFHSSPQLWSIPGLRMTEMSLTLKKHTHIMSRLLGPKQVPAQHVDLKS